MFEIYVYTLKKKMNLFECF